MPAGQSSKDIVFRREWLTWEGGRIPEMARQLYKEGDWAGAAILADMLEDAGAGQSLILANLRGLGVRGMWALDFLLGFESPVMFPTPPSSGNSVQGSQAMSELRRHRRGR